MKQLTALVIVMAVTGGAALADNTKTYTGPPWGAGTAIKTEPAIGSTTPGTVPPGFLPGGAPIQFQYTDRDTIGGFFQTYFLCPACGYTGTYTPYQVGGYIAPNAYTAFPPQLASQLAPPPAGTQYVFANGNALLVSQSNGQILDVIPVAQQQPVIQPSRTPDFSAPPVTEQPSQ